ncbi:MAG TPA: hypothetical protein VFA83_14025 [Acidimicrobiales bacterium]|nr:hypothetical protein [Acidimicrobiales bacterium]
MRKHLTRVLAGVATLAVAGGMAFASPASAEPNTGSQPAKKSCVNPETGKTDQPHGTVWTSTTQNGQVASTYKCNDGTWERQPDKAQTTGGTTTGGTGGTRVTAVRGTAVYAR